MKITGKGWFSIVLLIIFLFFAIDSFNYGHRTRIIPLLVVCFSLIFTVIQVAKDVFASPQTNDDPQTHNTGKSQWLFVFYTLVWLSGFAILLNFSNYLIAVPVFLFFYVWLVGKVKIVNALGTAIGLVLFMFIMFELIVGARL